MCNCKECQAEARSEEVEVIKLELLASAEYNPELFDNIDGAGGEDVYSYLEYKAECAAQVEFERREKVDMEGYLFDRFDRYLDRYLD